MKVLALVSLAVIATTISGLPATTRSPAEPDDCSKECLNGVMKYGQELSVLKHSDLSNYFNNLDEVCEVITAAKNCLEKCGVTSNPFALGSLNLVCQPKTQEKIAILKQCLKYIDSNINDICVKECSPEHLIDETTAKMDPIVKKANGNCANFKCMARCNVEVVADQCGKDLGAAFEDILQEVVDTQRKDLENLNLVEAMEQTSPPECNYLYDPKVLFGEAPKSAEKQESEKAAEETTKADPKEDVKSLYAQAQLQLLLKQLELTEKQDQLIERENAKLDMEMAYIAHKSEQQEPKQHAIRTFVPLEKQPKDPAAMELFSQQPSEQPAVPSTENQQQPSMPMNFPHPMPLEIIPEQPMQKQQRPKIGPIMINGMPMEFVPMGVAPMEMPMEAMPRFL